METNALKNEIETYMEGCLASSDDYNKKIYEAMHYSVSIGGKRIRPLLFILTYNMFKGNYSDIMPVAAAIEMIHTYSLIHDDLPCMDNDDLRRGKPTNHKIFGEAIAVLSGDALLNEAMNLMFKFCLGKDDKTLKACSLISMASGAEGMIGGQVVDILSEGRKISYEELLYMHSKKTGALIKASILAGALLGNANADELETLNKFGEKLGLAFQIKDDILNVIGDERLVGKSIHSDEENNKTNFITTFGLNECKKMCSSLTEECLSLLDNIPYDTKDLKDLSIYLLRREF
ncbi:polyprenyl synthetase family protein [Candidatus Clostridium radicumherbarum]|uniref:Polyprenyl synthetase family protein n=1 Tax=Candidatus Clostridium radicumherbarum TaxID=3381662 RepID=A0ABW8TSF7_9CLOT